MAARQRIRRVLFSAIAGVALLAVLLVFLIDAGNLGSAYDRPLVRSAPGEWMEALDSDYLRALLEPADRQRWLDLPGVANARDLGGYPTYDGRTTRWNTVFRSGRLRDMNEHGCEVFRAHEIRTVIDLRNRLVVDTASHDGDPACVQDAANMMLFRFIPPRRKEPNKAQATRALVSRNVNAITNVFNTLADRDNLPLLYHCTAGKDRAGIISYLLLELLGVDRRVIRAEYDLSGEVGKSAGYQGIDAIFADIDQAGGIHEYLLNMGVSYQTQRRIRENLLTSKQG
jgi:protein-tyrosine phosphatase